MQFKRQGYVFGMTFLSEWFSPEMMVEKAINKWGKIMGLGLSCC